MNSVIVTLFEGDYVLGVGSLINSLYQKGFRGTIYVGFRGLLSLWTKGAQVRDGYQELSIDENLHIRFITIDSGWHLANLKPTFMLQVLDMWESDAQTIYYFDPDIVTTCRWTFYEEWVEYGVALCQEVMHFPMASSHPIRKAWQAWLVQNGFTSFRVENSYVNSGFVGMKTSDRGFLETWRQLHDQAAASGEDMNRFHWADNTRLFRGIDQDLLNCTMMVSHIPTSVFGPDGMGFSQAGLVMEHATCSPKPWQKRYIWDAMSGMPPSRADKAWLKHTYNPIQVLSAGASRRLKLAQVLSAGIGRFIRRS